MVRERGARRIGHLDRARRIRLDVELPSPLDGVEELFTSLLVRATSASRRAGNKVDRVGRSRTTRYQWSFLVAFAVRIGERLRDAVHTTVEDATITTGTELVPLLEARRDVAEALAHATFPEMSRFAPSASDGEGWHAGRLFGDLTHLLRSSSPAPADEPRGAAGSPVT